MTGVMTVMRTYAHKVLDKYLDVFGLAFGREGSDAEWEARLQDYIGPDMIPAYIVHDSQTAKLPMQIMRRAWQATRFTRFSIFHDELDSSV